MLPGTGGCMSTQGDREPSGVVFPDVEQPAPSGDAERIVKPCWSRPEITSFKPVADAQGVAARIGDGISNLS
jgi:hypothetical protein